MTFLTCRDVERRLAAFHDRELPVGEMIAVEAHIDDCPPCAATAARAARGRRRAARLRGARARPRTGPACSPA